MRIEAKDIDRSLRVAEQEEVLQGSSTIISDLRSALNPEVLNNGIVINFLSDRVATAKVIAALQLEEQLRVDPPKIQIQEHVVACGALKRYAGLAHKQLASFSILDMLDIMQFEYWSPVNERHTFNLDSSKNDILSMVIIANTVQSPVGTIGDFSRPALVIGTRYKNKPDVALSDYDPGNIEALPRVLKSIKEDDYKHHRRPNVIGGLAEWLRDTGMDLYMPGKNYFMKIGHVLGERLVGNAADVGTFSDFHLVLENGGLTRVPSDF